MNTLVIVLIAAVVLVCAYAGYGRWLAKTWGVDPNAKTPAVRLEGCMRKGLAILKKDRIGTMRELLEYCSEEPVPTAAFPSKRRRKWPIFLLGAVVIAGGAYAAKVGFHSTKSAEQYYEEGNYEKALAAYREAGDTENVKRVLQAAYDRAEDYSQGNNGYEKNEEEAIRYYKLICRK